MNYAHGIPYVNHGFPCYFINISAIRRFLLKFSHFIPEGGEAEFQ